MLLEKKLLQSLVNAFRDLSTTENIACQNGFNASY